MKGTGPTDMGESEGGIGRNRTIERGDCAGVEREEAIHTVAIRLARDGGARGDREIDNFRQHAPPKILFTPMRNRFSRT